MKSSLDHRLRTLVADFGKGQVEQALAKIEIAASMSSPNRAAHKIRNGKASRKKQRPTTGNRHVERACVGRPEFRASLEILGTMYQERRFLKDFRDIAWFLRDHGCDQCPDSRARALKPVMEILARMIPSDLEKTLAEALERDKVGDFMMLANAIMGIPDKKSDRQGRHANRQ